MVGPTGLSLKMTLVQLPAVAGAGSASPLTRRFGSLLRAPHGAGCGPMGRWPGLERKRPHLSRTDA